MTGKVRIGLAGLGRMGRIHAPPKAEFLAGSGGFFVDVTIHDLDTARWMVGEIVEGSISAGRAGPSRAGRTTTACRGRGC